MSLRFEVISTQGSTQSGYRMVSVDLWKSVFCQGGNFLSRRVATGVWFVWGRVPRLKSWARG
jgi:hypothetical protein